MINFENSAFQPCKEWIAAKIDSHCSWEEIQKLCVNDSEFDETMQMLIDEESWPLRLNRTIWLEFVAYYKGNLIVMRNAENEDVVAIDNGGLSNHFPIPMGYTSSWEKYKGYLHTKMSADSITKLQKSCHWILNHLLDDTRSYGVVKGLVTGSVQSGKTANMEGLISMAADYDWNFFIVLSGTIDNLRKQTRDRFIEDLKNSEGGVLWRVLDFTAEDKKFLEDELKLNSLTGTKNYANRYLTVCLKNKTRLERLINWLYSDPKRTNKLRIVVIDDEADQASINTAEITLDEEQERCAINQMIVNLVNGKMADGSIPPGNTKFQSMNYISYTATPYANVLNEGPGESLYPKDFICTLPEAYEYFGAKVIFGNDEENCPGLPIIRRILPSEEDQLKAIHKEQQFDLPDSFKKALAWFLCAAAIQRKRGTKKSISMLIHTAAIQAYHFVIYERVYGWLVKVDEVLSVCKNIYDIEIHSVTKEDLMDANPDYGFLSEINEEYPSFDELEGEILDLLADIRNITLGDDKKLEYGEGIHLCVDNCRANKEAEEGTYLRIVYPTEAQMKEMNKAPVFIVVGGNTLSRGLTIDGLVCTYFARNSNLADTLMQMARWFGYRRGYELLQRIWMTDSVVEKFEALTKIDMDLKREVERFMKEGVSPSKFGPRIRNIPEIAKFRITSKKKSQQAEYDDFDFCGDSYETTDFEDGKQLWGNIQITEEYLAMLMKQKKPRRSDAAKAWVWDGIPYSNIKNSFLARYAISKHSSLYKDLPFFSQWIDSMNADGKFTDWNVAVVDGENTDNPWTISEEIKVGQIERTRKTGKDYVDIGALRSGLDALCDANVATMNEEQKELFKRVCKERKDIISERANLNLENTPLLLIYRVKKDGGTPRANSVHRERLNTECDIIGISIIVSGDSIGDSHAKSLRIKIREEI
ncbi:MAG: Z1 domain-containing protein [Lachnospiraceae bacterium]|nr:Z1 domain-containing protein [Lachnospiraceae bacterium]